MYSLTGNKRAQDDPAWAAYLLQVGDGRVPVEAKVGPAAIRLPDEICAPETWSAQDLLTYVFPDLAERARACAEPGESRADYEFFKTRAVLAPTNVVVNEINELALDAMESAGSDITTYFSTDSIQGGTEHDYGNYPLDFLHSLNPTGVPPHALRLAPGSVVILLRNLDASIGLMNGIRCVVKRCLPRFLDVYVLTGRAAGQRIYIPRIPLAPKTAELPFVLVRRQFPVRLAWAMSINKAQGRSLENAGLALLSPVFSHGQLYVALSRVGAYARVKVWVQPWEQQGTHSGDASIPDGTYTDNIVWTDALLQAAATQPPPTRTLPDRAHGEVETHDDDDAAAEKLRDAVTQTLQQTSGPDTPGSTGVDALARFEEAAALLLSLEPEEITHIVAAGSDLVVPLIRDLAARPGDADENLELLLKTRASLSVSTSLDTVGQETDPEQTEGTTAAPTDPGSSSLRCRPCGQTIREEPPPLPTDEEMKGLLAALQTPYIVHRGEPHGENNCLIDSLLLALADQGYVVGRGVAERKLLCHQVRTHLNAAHGLPADAYPFLDHAVHARDILRFFVDLGEALWAPGVNPK